MNVQTGKKQQEGRNPRAELRALMRRDLLLPAAIGYDIAVSPDAIVDWLKGERKSADFVASIIEFIDAYNHTWGMLAVASNAVRAEMGLKFISNIGVLINEIETAPINWMTCCAAEIRCDDDRTANSNGPILKREGGSS